MPSPLRAPRVPAATQADWDRFADAIESRLRLLEQPVSLPIREGLAVTGQVALELGTVLCVSPCDGQELAVLLPVVRDKDEGMLSGVLRLTSVGRLTLYPPGGGTIDGMPSQEVLAPQAVTLLYPRKGSWHSIGGLG